MAENTNTEREALRTIAEWPITQTGQFDAMDAVNMKRVAQETLASTLLPAAGQEPVAWTGGEEWEQLAWHLCAEENGEESCGEMIWEGGPTPEPWGERWMKYEHDAKRMIETVRKFAAPPPQAVREPLTAHQIHEAIKDFKESGRLMGVNHIHVARAIERAHDITKGEHG
jgi:hypothetical protein